MRKIFNSYMLLAQTTGCCDLMNTQEEASCVFGELSHQKKSLRWCQCLKAWSPKGSSEIPVGVARRDLTGQLLSLIRLEREEQVFILSDYGEKQLQTPNAVYECRDMSWNWCPWNNNTGKVRTVFIWWLVEHMLEGPWKGHLVNSLLLRQQQLSLMLSGLVLKLNTHFCTEIAVWLPIKTFKIKLWWKMLRKFTPPTLAGIFF